LHRHGNELSWWANMQILPLEIAKDLWGTSPIHGGTLVTINSDRAAPAQASPEVEP
jgi:hypothetical protein